MKQGVFAIYKGKEYSADFIKQKEIVLRSYDKSDMLHGFQTYNGYNKDIRCVLFVNRDNIQEIYKLTTYAYYKGYKFQVIEEKDDMISIWSLFGEGDYKVWIDLGMKNVNKGEYQKWIKKSEAKIEIEKEML